VFSGRRERLYPRVGKFISTTKWDFAVELALHGPRPLRRFPPSLQIARSYCARLARSHSENFTVASVLLPRRLLSHFHAIYAYCRWADDLADETGGGQHTIDLLAWWRRELFTIFDGEPRHPITIALRETVRRFHIPSQPFLDLLVAFEQDQRVKRYDSFDQLLNYCRNSANPVGRLVLCLFECATPDRIKLADDVCTGLQLANFWQDVSRDLDIGRIYLPAEDLARFGVSDADLAAKQFTPAFAELLRFEVERTREFFARGRGLLPLIPRRLQVDIDLFIRCCLQNNGKLSNRKQSARFFKLSDDEIQRLEAAVAAGYPETPSSK